MENHIDLKSKSHKFGGDWTETKLKVIANYLVSYTTALKNTPFKKIYIDAFAGTGYRTQSYGEEYNYFDLLTDEIVKKDTQKLLDGSARIALKTNPRFDKYIFIENNLKRCETLVKLKEEFPDQAKDIFIINEDANTAINNICNSKWYSQRAVLFLDPYGMQVNWKTIECISQTNAIDMWMLFPLGIAINRILRRNGKISEANRKKLDLFFGTTDWYNEFYTTNRQANLLENNEEDTFNKCSMEKIAEYINQRLNELFPGVSKKQGVLLNSKNNPLYLLCFAASNDKGKDIAIRIANNILGKIPHVTKL